MRKVLILIIFFYTLALLQTSFFIHFNIYGVGPNLILISVILLNFFEKPNKNSGLLAAGMAGFFLDLFSNFPLGLNVFALIILAFLIKKILGILKEENIIYFIPLFILAMIFYNLFPVVFSAGLKLSFPSSFNFGKLEIFEIVYNLVLGILGFYLVKLCSQKVLRK